MRFELDNTLIDEITFYMENQDGDFLFDTQDRKIIDIFNEMIEEENDYNSDRYISLPKWGSKDGYRLMEKFAVNLKSPLIRQELSNALNRKKGVFRAYRDVLSQYPESEKQWFAFKEQEMKDEVLAWYNSLREQWGLEPIGSEPEDNSSLILEDFLFKEKEEKNIFTISALTEEGEIAGTINASKDEKTIHINILEVKEEYRGMGIAKTLLSKMLEKLYKMNLDITIDLPVETDFFARSLLLENFKPLMQRFILRK